MSESDAPRQQAEERFDRVEAVLDEVRRILVLVERAQDAADRARADVRKLNFMVVGSAVVLAVIVVVSRNKH